MLFLNSSSKSLKFSSNLRNSPVLTQFQHYFHQKSNSSANNSKNFKYFTSVLGLSGLSLALFYSMNSHYESNSSIANSLSFWSKPDEKSRVIYNKNNIPNIITGGCNTPLDMNSTADAERSSNSPLADINSVKILNNNEIDNAIKAEEKKYLLERGLIKEIHTNFYRANYSIEDSFCILPKLSLDSGILMGIFDGHSGSAASYFARTELLHYLQVYKARNWVQTLINEKVFLDADNHFLEFSLHDNRPNDGLSGACMNVVHIAQNKITCANAGDCRAVIGRKVKNNTTGKFEYKAIELSTDHQIDTNPAERERLLSEHLDEADIIKRDRVKGRLQPTRGLGDGFYKNLAFFQLRTRLAALYKQFTPPYTTAKPDITEHTLNSEDDFLILSTDGLYQDCNSQIVVDTIAEYLNNKQHQSITASSFLIKKALQSASEHEIGRRTKPNLNLSWILNLIPGSRRNVHDDLSVLVVFFDHNQKFESDSPDSSQPLTIPPTLQRAISLTTASGADPNSKSQQQQTSSQIRSNL